MYSLKVYDSFFLFAQLNLPNVLISIAKRSFDSNFPSLCFDVPKVSNFISGGVKKQETGNDSDVISGLQASQKNIFLTFSYFLINNALLYHFLAN